MQVSVINLFRVVLFGLLLTGMQQGLAQSNLFEPNPSARTGSFLRGTGTAKTYQTFVTPLDYQKGVALDLADGNVTNWFTPNLWTNQLNHYNATNSVSPISFKNPLAAFGSISGATPLYVGRSYRYEVGFGDSPANTNETNVASIKIDVFNQTNLQSVGTIQIQIPRKKTLDYTNFVRQGISHYSATWGLTTMVHLVSDENIFPATYRLTHIAENDDHVFLVNGAGRVPRNDTDYDGRSDAQEMFDGTDPLDANSVIPVRLAAWNFEGSTSQNAWLTGDRGQLPRNAINISQVTGKRGNGAQIDTPSHPPGAFLNFEEVEANGQANINLQRGSVRLWFKPNWGTTGPYGYGRLVEVGTWSADASKGLWSLAFDQAMNPSISLAGHRDFSYQVYFNTTNTLVNTQWSQVVLTYDANVTKLYFNTNQVAEGGGITAFPDEFYRRLMGLEIGNDQGSHQAKGVYDEVEFFNYPLSLGEIRGQYEVATDSSTQTGTWGAATLTDPTLPLITLVATGGSSTTNALIKLGTTQTYNPTKGIGVMQLNSSGTYVSSTTYNTDNDATQGDNLAGVINNAANGTIFIFASYQQPNNTSKKLKEALARLGFIHQYRWNSGCAWLGIAQKGRGHPWLERIDQSGASITHTQFDFSYTDWKAANSDERFPMVTNSSSAWTAMPLYVMNFEHLPPWRSLFVDRPHFEIEPLPQDYVGKRLEEITAPAITWPNLTSLNPTNYLTLGHSPELRTNHLLNNFVVEMRKDPIALANYVQNEIKLVDWYDYNTNDASSASLEYGGINRGAYGVFTEGCGSPIEQCSLLIYLLRSAGYPAIYMFPTNNGLKMLDRRMDSILQLKISGQSGVSNLVSCNYPWVAVHTGTNWVHLFPWIKDTEVTDGFNLYDYLPTNYNTGYKWATNYLFGDTNIFSLSQTSDQVPVLFRKFIEKHVATNQHGISIDDLGTQVTHRRNHYVSWDQFPTPLSLQGWPRYDESLKNYPNLFNTIQLTFYAENAPNKSIDTTEIRLAEFHGRNLFLMFEKTGTDQHRMMLNLSPFDYAVTNRGPFTATSHATYETQKLWGVRMTNTVQLASTNDVILCRVAHRIHHNTPWTKYFSKNNFDYKYGENGVASYDYTAMGTIFVQTQKFRKGDTAAFTQSLQQMTERIMDPHLRQIQAHYNRMQSDTNAVADPEVYLGLMLHTMGASFWKQYYDFDQWNTKLHRVARISSYGHGFSLLRPYRSGGNLPNGGEIHPIEPVIDINALGGAFMFNGRNRPDTGGMSPLVNRDYYAVNAAAASAFEHNTIAKFYGHEKGVSTAYLLRHAGAGNVWHLTSDNYMSYANSISSMNQGVWNKIAGHFSKASYRNKKEVFVNSSIQTVGNYQGIGAFVMEASGAAGAYISGAILANGGQATEEEDAEEEKDDVTVEYVDGMWIWKNKKGELIKHFYVYRMAETLEQFSSGEGMQEKNQLELLTLQAQAGNLFAIKLVGGASNLSPNAQALLTAMEHGISAEAVSWVHSFANKVQDPVDAVSGEFYIREIDLEVSGPFPIRLERTYLSHTPAYSSLGFGWKFSFVPFLTVGAETNVIFATEMDGETIAYGKDTTNIWRPKQALNPQMTNNREAGKGGLENPFNNYIEKTTEGTNTVFKLYGADGSLRTYVVRTFPVSILERERPYLRDWKDNRGNTLSFEYGEDIDEPEYGQLRRIQSSNGSYVNLRYNAYGQITDAGSSDGRAVRYEYDTYGDLVKVINPDQSATVYEYGQSKMFEHPDSPWISGVLTCGSGGQCVSYITNAFYIASGSIVTDYKEIVSSIPVDASAGAITYTNIKKTYVINISPEKYNMAIDYIEILSGKKIPIDSNHRIVKQIKSGGRVLENIYDWEGRVVAQKATVGRDMATYTNAVFIYSNNFPEIYKFSQVSTGVVSGYTIVIDAYGKTNRYDYTNNLITKVTDPYGYTKIQDWYEPSETNKVGYYPRSLEASIDERLLTTQYQYDSRGNVTNLTVIGDLTGEGSTNQQTGSIFKYNALNALTETLDTSGKGQLLRYSTTYPYLPTNIVQTISGTSTVTNALSYYNVTNVIGSGPSAVTNRAFGLLRYSTNAYGSTDAARSEWAHDGRGYITSQISHTGTSDPAVTNYFLYDHRGQLVEQIDAAGRAQKFDYTMLGKIQAKEIYEAGSSIPLIAEYQYYNLNGEPTWTDGPRYGPDDYIWRDYDGAGRLTQEMRWRSRAKSDGSGVEAETGDRLYSTTFHAYDLFGNRTNSVDPLGNFVVMQYDALGRMTNQIAYGADAPSTLLTQNIFAYEPGGEVSVHTNAMNGITRAFYTWTGKPYRKENPDGSTNQWVYYLDGRVKREILPNGSYLEVAYDDLNRRQTNYFKNSAGTTLTTEVKEFDRRGNLIKVTDAAGNVFTTVYDGLNRVKSTAGPTDAFSGQQRMTNYYDAAGVVLVTRNALGDTTSTRYDAAGRPTQVSVATSANVTNRLTRYIYSTNQHSVTTIVGTGTTAITNTVFTDTFGKTVLEQFQPTSQFRLNTYDRAGNLTSSRDEIGRVSSFSYDGLNRVQISTLPDGAGITNSYNGLGNLTQKDMPGGRALVSVFDNAGRLRTNWLRGASGGVTRGMTNTYYTTGTIGQLYQVKDARGLTHTSAYDEWSRLKTSITTGGTAEQNISTTNSYDLLGRLTLRSQAVGSDLSAVERGYDAYGQVLDEKVYLNGQLERWLNQKWNTAGRRTELNVPGAGYGSVAQFGYRSDGLMSQVTQGGQVYSFNYGDHGLLTSRSNPFRTATINQRDRRGRVTQTTLAVGGTTRLVETMTWRANSTLNSYYADRTGSWDENRDYTYNDRGQLVSEEIATSGSDLVTTTYGFDTSKLGVLTSTTQSGAMTNRWQVGGGGQPDQYGRLTQEQLTMGRWVTRGRGTAPGAQSVALTLDGNPVSSVDYDSGNPSGDWEATLSFGTGSHTLIATASHPWNGATNYLTKRTNTFSTQASTAIDQYYDALGNTTNRVFTGSRTNQLTWDGAGRLLRVVEKVGSATNYVWTAKYDAFGRRLLQTETKGTNTTVIGSWYDPLVEFLEIGVSYNGNRTWKVHGPDLAGGYGGLQGIGGAEATIQESDGASYGLLTDYFGHAMGLANGLAIQWSNVPWGGYGAVLGYEAPRLSLSTSLAEAVGWQQRRTDITGLYYLGARYYDPIAGKFLSPDPMGHDASMDLYNYAGGDPINYLDPDGRLANKVAQEARIFSDAAYASGFGFGDGLKVAGDFYSELGQQTDSTALNFGGNMVGSFFNIAGGLIMSKTYEDMVGVTYDNAVNVMAGELANGSGVGWSLLQGGSSIVGDVVGYNSLMSGAFGVDRQSATLLSTPDRWSQGLMGGSQMTLSLAGLAALRQEMVTVYRGTDFVSEIDIYNESGAVLSDAGRSAYQSVRGGGASVNEALAAAHEASRAAHANQLSVWGSLDSYVQAHGVFGLEISEFGPRSMISFSTSPEAAARFGSTILEFRVPRSQLVPQTFPGAGEAEVLIINGIR